MTRMIFGRPLWGLSTKAVIPLYGMFVGMSACDCRLPIAVCGCRNPSYVQSSMIQNAILSV